MSKSLLIFKTPGSGYIPYDIENSSELVIWKESDAVIYPAPRENGDVILEEDISQFSQLGKRIKALLQQENIKWREVAPLWGEFSCLRDRINFSSEDEEILSGILLPELEKDIENQFTSFILDGYGELFFGGFMGDPVTVDRILPYVIHQGGSKKALICLDCMGFQEWLCVKQYLQQKGVQRFQERALYAMVPTLTSISRSALFTGEKNYSRQVNEEKGFFRYLRKNWRGGTSDQVRYFPNEEPTSTLAYLDYDFVGIVFNLIDSLTHNTQPIRGGKMLLQENLPVVLRETELADIVVNFLEKDYRVFLASDHGSFCCRGLGYGPGKYLVEDKAKRAALYPNRALALDFTQGREQELLLLKIPELLGEQCAVFPRGRKMFGSDKKFAITHGGIHIEEVLVPFVEVYP